MNVLILHGAHGGPDTNWFPWLTEYLNQAGHEVQAPKFPTPDGQSRSSWEHVISREVARKPRDTVLVGHSLGAALALRLAEHSHEPYAGAFLVAGFFGPLGLPDYDPINASFFDEPMDWAKVRRNLKHSHCYAGDNDPYVPLHFSQAVADNIGCGLTTIPDGGHLNSESGFVRFEALAGQICRLASRTETRNQ